MRLRALVVENRMNYGRQTSNRVKFSISSNIRIVKKQN